MCNVTGMHARALQLQSLVTMSVKVVLHRDIVNHSEHCNRTM